MKVIKLNRPLNKKNIEKFKKQYDFNMLLYGECRIHADEITKKMFLNED